MQDEDLQFPGLVDEATTRQRSRHSILPVDWPIDEIRVRFEIPSGIYDLLPPPAPPMPSIITLDGWPGVPDAIMVNGVRFIPAGGR